MKKTLITSLLTLAGTVYAQGPHRGPGGWGGDMHIMGLEGGRPGAVVTGAPFSGKAVTTSTQTLADGTHIQHTNTAQFYRDSQGRTRIERTFNGFGSGANSTTPKTTVEIFDPVGGFIYMLNASTLTATKVPMPTPPSAADAAQRQAHREAAESSEQVVTTSLGTQTVQGVSCASTQTTRTIAAGTIGNDREIKVTSQRCVSPELQITLESKRTDPHMGETDFEFQNISRSEPDSSLFQVPAGYTVTAKASMRQGGYGAAMHSHPQAPPAAQ